jgi:hypothetical protein
MKEIRYYSNPRTGKTTQIKWHHKLIGRVIGALLMCGVVVIFAVCLFLVFAILYFFGILGPIIAIILLMLAGALIMAGIIG